jgi:hypothetical protein
MSAQLLVAANVAAVAIDHADMSEPRVAAVAIPRQVAQALSISSLVLQRLQYRDRWHRHSRF